MECKKPLLSKTLWVNAIVALTALLGFPFIGDYIMGNPDSVVMGVSLINIALRFLTKDKLQIG